MVAKKARKVKCTGAAKCNAEVCHHYGAHAVGTDTWDGSQCSAWDECDYPPRKVRCVTVKPKGG